MLSKSSAGNPATQWTQPHSPVYERRKSVSHIVQIQSQVEDAAAVRSACECPGLQQPVQGTVKLFSGQVTGLAVQLLGWHYPAVFDVTTGQTRYDSCGSRVLLLLQAFARARPTGPAPCNDAR
jgi:hypothetical protein